MPLKTVALIAGVVVLLSFSSGALDDLVQGLPLWWRSSSWQAWVLLVTVCGFIGLSIEFAHGWIAEPDRLRDRGPRRGARIAIVIVIAASIAVAAIVGSRLLGS